MSRDIVQYHYTMWPDHDTPEPLNLAVFHSQVLRTSSDENRTPLVVHCRYIKDIGPLPRICIFSFSE